MGKKSRSDAIREGMERARAHGRLPGRPSTGDAAWPQIEDMLDQGYSIEDIAANVGLSTSTVRRLLRKHDR